jgi:2-oxoglutarate dehydrogenase E2 component (dihydrolipoamide succinyltransferase)
MSTEVKVPVLGESITEATLGQWLKKPGEAVAIDEPIASLETDKVAVEVPSPIAGIMGAYAVEEGATVNVGAVIGSIDAGTGASSPAVAPVVAAAAVAPVATTTLAPAPAAEAENSDLPLSPAVRRLVLELGIDPSKIKGTGKDGRLTKEDVVAAAKGAPASSANTPVAATPTTQVTGGRQEERVKMTRLRQTIAKRLKSAQDTAALLTTFNDVDMSAVIEARATYKDLFEKKHGVRLGFMGFFTKAVALAARDVPAVNAKIEGDEIVYHNYLDVSVAVSAPNGLVVPVVRNADAMSFAQIEKTIGDFGAKAKAGTLTMDDMSGGTFTISNGGVFGSLMSTPIINPPQSAVLGLHRIEDRAVVRDGHVVVRPMMYLALSYDHRLIDGREAVTFLKIVKEAIEDPTRLLIDL